MWTNSSDSSTPVALAGPRSVASETSVGSETSFTEACGDDDDDEDLCFASPIAVAVAEAEDVGGSRERDDDDDVIDDEQKGSTRTSLNQSTPPTSPSRSRRDSASVSSAGSAGVSPGVPIAPPIPSNWSTGTGWEHRDFNTIINEIASFPRDSSTLHPGVPVKKRSKFSSAIGYIRRAVLGDGRHQENIDDNASVLFTVTAWKHGPRPHYDEDGEEVSDSKLPDVVTTNDQAQKQLNTPVKSPGQRFARFYATNKVSFLLCVAIVAAYVYPKLGAVYLQPEITTAWIVVPYVLRKYCSRPSSRAAWFVCKGPVCVCVCVCLFA
jgi:hypothetical protein